LVHTGHFSEGRVEAGNQVLRFAGLARQAFGNVRPEKSKKNHGYLKGFIKFVK